MALYFGGPLWILGWLGYRYGYGQQISRAGLLWRAVLFCSILSWSVAGGQAHEAESDLAVGSFGGDTINEPFGGVAARPDCGGVRRESLPGGKHGFCEIERVFGESGFGGGFFEMRNT